MGNINKIIALLDKNPELMSVLTAREIRIIELRRRENGIYPMPIPGTSQEFGVNLSRIRKTEQAILAKLLVADVNEEAQAQGAPTWIQPRGGKP